MTSVVDYQAIMQEFITGWGSRTPVRIVNSPQGSMPGKDEEWISVDIVEGPEAYNEWCSPDRRSVVRAGVIAVNIYVPKGQGTVAMRGHRDFAMGILQGKVLDTTLYVKHQQSWTEIDDPAWHASRLIVEYERVEQVTVS